MAQPIIAVVKSEGLAGLHAFVDRFARELTTRMLLLGNATVTDCHPSHLRILGQ
jgi:isopentenyl diphosphate isomerase/L-lactate dehydrogenase-like FMN-dependent dehydrogenase